MSCVLVGNTLTWEHGGSGFDHRYVQIHSGLDDHLKRLKNPREIDKW